MAERFVLRTFGALALESDGQHISKFSTKKCALLLARLAAEKDQRIGRDRLAEILWPDDYLDLTRQRLRQELRRLKSDAGEFGAFIRADRQWIEIEPDALTTDAIQFDELITAAEKTEDQQLRVQLLEHAVALMQGPFLTGFAEPWVSAIRRSYEEKARRAWLALADAHEANGDPDRALSATMNAVHHDPLDSDANAQLIRRLFERGQESKARQAFFEFDAMMFREFGKHAPDSVRIPLGSVKPEVKQAPAKELSAVSLPRPGPVTGRDDVLATVAAALDRDGASVVLVGTIGVGKRHILREAAWRFAQSSGLPVQLGGECSSVADGLFVLEGVEDMAALESQMESARRNGWRVIADAHRRIEVEGVTEIVVTPLPVPAVNASRDETLANPSVQLLLSQFSETAISNATVAELTAIAELARQLNGLPIALKAFAPRLILQSPSQLLSALDATLSEFGRSNFKTLGPVISALEPESRQALIGLSCLDGASLELSAYIATADVWQSLERECLIVIEEVGPIRRLRVPRPLAVAVRGLVGAKDLRSIRELTYVKLALFAFNMDYYLVGANQDYFFKCMESEFTNLFSTIEWSIDNKPSLTSQLVYGTWRTLCARGNPARDAEILFRGAKAAVGHESDDLMVGRAWTGAAIALSIGGRLDLAEVAFKAGIAAFEKGGDATGMGWANLNYVGGVLMETDPDRALEVARIAVEQSVDSTNRTIANAAYAEALASVGQFEEAIRVAEKVFAERVGSEDISAQGRAYGELAHIYQLTGRTEAARPLAIEGVKRLREVGVQDLLLDALIYRAELSLELEEVDAVLDEAEDIARRTGSSMALLEVARRRFQSASMRRNRTAMIASVEQMFEYSQKSTIDREVIKSLRLLAQELDRNALPTFANALRASLGDTIIGPANAGWQALLSSDSKPTICVLAVVLAKEALSSNA